VSGLRDRLIRGAIFKSAQFIQLRWHERYFYNVLLHWVDDYGRFEADVEILRGGLYHPYDMRKVPASSVREMLMRCHELGLVKLYTVKGKGFGRVVGFDQRMKYPRAEHPPEPDAEMELALGLDGAVAQAAAATEVRQVFEPEVVAKKVSRNRSPERVRREFLAEKSEVERELDEILRPGGSAYKMTPTGEKKLRYDVLFARREQLLRELKKLDALRCEEEAA